MDDPLAGHHKYTNIRELGAGSFGVVHLAINRQASHLLLQVSNRVLANVPLLTSASCTSCNYCCIVNAVPLFTFVLQQT